MVDEFRAEHPGIAAVCDREAAAKPVNPTGLSRTEIRLLAEAVSAANDWRGSLVGNPDPKPLWEFDARINKMKAAIRKLKVASGYTFSGAKKK